MPPTDGARFSDPTALFGLSTVEVAVPVASSPDAASESLGIVDDLVVSLAGVDRGVSVPWGW